jgi:hypothetical protein
MPAFELFADESRRRDYLLCAAVVPDQDIELARKIMRDLKPRNRSRLHISDERNRDRIIGEFVRLKPISEAHVFIASMQGVASERHIRTRCLDALACYAADVGATRILVESCSQDKQDKAALTDTLARLGALNRIRVAVDKPTSHELLWAADLVAWSYSAGGNPRKRIAHLVTVHEVT